MKASRRQYWAGMCRPMPLAMVCELYLFPNSLECHNFGNVLRDNGVFGSESCLMTSTTGLRNIKSRRYIDSGRHRHLQGPSAWSNSPPVYPIPISIQLRGTLATITDTITPRSPIFLGGTPKGQQGLLKQPKSGTNAFFVNHSSSGTSCCEYFSRH
jgi:hypothetical protein